MKNYSRGTLKNFSKEELLDYIQVLQQNLTHEEELNNHMYMTICAVMSKDIKFSSAVGEVLEVWNKSSGHRYSEVEV